MSAEQEEIIQLLQQLLYGRRESYDAPIRALATVDRALFLRTVRELLYGSETSVKLWQQVSYALAIVEPGATAEFLSPFLADDNDSRRWEAAAILGDVGGKSAVEPLMRVVKDEPNPDVRHLMVFALGKLGDQRAIEVLEWIKVNDTGEDYEGRSIAKKAADSIERILTGRCCP